jgi:hypothetical protein
MKCDVMLAIAVATLAHTTMLLLMGPVTLAIQECEMEYSFTTAAYVLMAHFLMMFSPTFVTGGLMTRFGPFKVGPFDPLGPGPSGRENEGRTPIAHHPPIPAALRHPPLNPRHAPPPRRCRSRAV